jgi:hypothetical protein
MARPRSTQPSEKQVAAIALMATGIRDHFVIARAIGMQAEQVAEIDMTMDENLRRLAIHGVPIDFAYPLRCIVRCPGCGYRITLAPCITCRNAKRITADKKERSVDKPRLKTRIPSQTKNSRV